MRDVGHQERAVLVRNGAERRIVPVPRVGGRAADNELWLEDLRLRRERLVVDELRRRVEPVREGLEVDGRRRHLLLRRLFAETLARDSASGTESVHARSTRGSGDHRPGARDPSACPGAGGAPLGRRSCSATSIVRGFDGKECVLGSLEGRE